MASILLGGNSKKQELSLVWHSLVCTSTTVVPGFFFSDYFTERGNEKRKLAYFHAPPLIASSGKILGYGASFSISVANHGFKFLKNC